MEENELALILIIHQIDFLQSSISDFIALLTHTHAHMYKERKKEMLEEESL